MTTNPSIVCAYFIRWRLSFITKTSVADEFSCGQWQSGCWPLGTLAELEHFGCTKLVQNRSCNQIFVRVDRWVQILLAESRLKKNPSKLDPNSASLRIFGSIFIIVIIIIVVVLKNSIASSFLNDLLLTSCGDLNQARPCRSYLARSHVLKEFFSKTK